MFLRNEKFLSFIQLYSLSIRLTSNSKLNAFLQIRIIYLYRNCLFFFQHMLQYFYNLNSSKLEAAKLNKNLTSLAAAKITLVSNISNLENKFVVMPSINFFKL